MKKTHTAVFLGGDRNGTSVELKGAHPKLISILEAATDGGMLLAERTKVEYTLVSLGPPLRYEVAI
jgi:hypothetical protein